MLVGYVSDDRYIALHDVSVLFEAEGSEPVAARSLADGSAPIFRSRMGAAHRADCGRLRSGRDVRPAVKIVTYSNVVRFVYVGDGKSSRWQTLVSSNVC
jgi:hypothetical protein